MGEVLALLSALCFGSTHFLGGLLARRADSAAVALVAQAGGTVLVLGAAPWVAATEVSPAALLWGSLSGVGTGVGVVFLYRAMSAGAFSVVAPLSDVAAVALPVLVGVALLGDRPEALTWCGIAAAAPALWLVSRSDSDGGGGGASRIAAGVRDALVAGGGFALQFIALAQVDPAAGLWPVVASRAASVLAILPLVLRRPVRLRLRPAVACGAVAAGALGSLAIVLFTLAAREQLLSVAVVLTALYPAIPVLLGLVVLGERLTRARLAGLLCAASAVALISLP
ncbi:putative membrane protein [Saccharopolyspora erythraea NRRL 2338]|uniref:Permease of the drug/metabolite transporter (DMT) superfamily n=2 Tax=Saccharopolyspora erythraea TaxID=1836 RepID=A4FHG2_SACEN|nr:EamA family transporter [Saccharopolyspora erythraea]EQD81644.1 DMT family permease [Saccharopolyspora erythraea D]PFG97182.1 putative membrane protein [Saccharopolyspora erythraea NRRL 2338]QRK87383.1 EamA family transporter [Saccharopolyspora erythraea]CAM03487.1 putative permease of the drug/metabolite transporter (DMT) superfamily [Saccharopolyspora erythraea NRRL 2338]